MTGLGASASSFKRLSMMFLHPGLKNPGLQMYKHHFNDMIVSCIPTETHIRHQQKEWRLLMFAPVAYMCEVPKGCL